MFVKDVARERNVRMLTYPEVDKQMMMSEGKLRETNEGGGDCV